MKRGLKHTQTASQNQSLKSTAKDFERLERHAADDAFNANPEHPNPLSETRERSGAPALSDASALTAQAREDRRQRELLEDALAMAQHANHAKSVFLANMSHDFRTPMNAIMSFTDIALDHLDNTDHVEDCLQKIKQSSAHLLTLLNDVLDVSRIESGKLRLNEQPLDLRKLGRELEEMFQPEVERRELAFTLDFSKVREPHVFGDDLRLSQVFINLIGNAVKFTDAGGTVVVDAVAPTRLTTDYYRYTFTVRDTGCGMSRAFIDHIFEPFERDRIDAVAHTVGTGLGMTITKNLIDMMGGSIEVESELGQGTTFTIHIPLKIDIDQSLSVASNSHASTPAEKERAARSRVDEVSERLAGKRVLVVDDDELSREILRELLLGRGLEVLEATNGDEAIECFSASEEGAIDAVLMDLHMPKVNGLQATRTIRALGRADSATVPIIATTACAFDEDRELAAEAGMTDHLSKPLDRERLFSLLLHLLG